MFRIFISTITSMFIFASSQAASMEWQKTLSYHNVESIECLALNIYFEARDEAVAGYPRK